MSSPGLEASNSLPTGVDQLTVFRTLFLASPDSLLLVDNAGAILLANPAAAQLLGHTVDELRAINVDALVPDSIRHRHASYRGAYALAPRPRPMGAQMELVAKRKNGSEVTVEISLSPLHDLGLVVAAIRDVGGYPRVKQALQQARFSEHLAELGRLAVDARDPKTLLDQVPAIAARALNVDAAAVLLRDDDGAAVRVVSGVGQVPDEQVGQRTPYRPDSALGLVLSQGAPLIVEDYRSERRFAVPPAYLEAGLVSALAVPVSDRGRTIGALVVRTRTARRFEDDEVRFLGSLASLLATSLQRLQSEEALNHAQRLESVGQLTGGIAHDFNNLLTVIQGNLQVLQELPALADDALVQRLVGAAARASRRGAELTSKLLAFSRRQVLQPTTVDVAAMLQSLADMLRRTLDQRIRIEVQAATDGPRALADPGQLEAALLNMAINARDAMPEGGTLRFSCEGGAAPPAELQADAGDASEALGRFVAIAIADTGIGMPDEVKERAFEPFFTTKEAGRGTGLGLSTVYGFAKQSRGAVLIDSAPGVGTTLRLYIPESALPDAPLADALSTRSSVPRGLRVLLVEDDGEVAQVVLAHLDTLGCEVIVASSAEQALLMLPDSSGIELLLSDIALGPGMRGTQLAAELRHRLSSVAVLLMSGFSSDLLDADRESPPDWELLRKPFSRAELANALVRALAAAHAG